MEKNHRSVSRCSVEGRQISESRLTGFMTQIKTPSAVLNLCGCISNDPTTYYKLRKKQSKAKTKKKRKQMARKKRKETNEKKKKGKIKKDKKRENEKEKGRKGKKRKEEKRREKKRGKISEFGLFKKDSGHH